MEARLVREELAKCWRTEGLSPVSSSLPRTVTDWGWGVMQASTTMKCATL